MQALWPRWSRCSGPLPGISMRAILSMQKVSGTSDPWRLYTTTRADEARFRYVAIPNDDVPSTVEQFNQVEMNRVFDYGREMAANGAPWRTARPGYVARRSDVAQD